MFTDVLDRGFLEERMGEKEDEELKVGVTGRDKKLDYLE